MYAGSGTPLKKNLLEEDEDPKESEGRFQHYCDQVRILSPFKG